MKKQRITLQEALHSNKTFLTFLAQEAHSEAYLGKKQVVEKGPHPTTEMLHEYVWAAMDENTSKIIRNHLSFCSICTQQIVSLGLIKQKAEEGLLSWANQVKQPEKEGLLGELAVEFWEPEGAGEALVAASSSVTQEHEFTTELGTIKIVCAWGQAVGDEPAFIWLSWDADIDAKSIFLIQLIHPETQTVHYEIRPGTIRKGNQTFTQEVLGFDPVSEKWAISIVTSESEE